MATGKAVVGCRVGGTSEVVQDGETGVLVPPGDPFALGQAILDMLAKPALTDHVAAISVGMVKGEPALDLDYIEDSEAETDANFVMTGAGGIVEIQGTAEKVPFTEAQFLSLLALARTGVSRLVEFQKLAVL